MCESDILLSMLPLIHAKFVYVSTYIPGTESVGYGTYMPLFCSLCTWLGTHTCEERSLPKTACPTQPRCVRTEPYLRNVCNGTAP